MSKNHVGTLGPSQVPRFTNTPTGNTHCGGSDIKHYRWTCCSRSQVSCSWFFLCSGTGATPMVADRRGLIRLLLEQSDNVSHAPVYSNPHAIFSKGR